MEQLVIELKSILLAGEHSMKINFTGRLTGKIVGFYRSIYKDDLGKER